ncbi:MAG: GWxTD domain-containing protein [Saprospiraceae bacterium]
MKKWLYLATLAFSSQIAHAINADIKPYVFAKDAKSYFEVLYYIPTNKLSRIYNKDSSYYHQVNLTVLLKQNNRIVRAEKFKLISPIMLTSQAMLHDFRMLIEPGEYELESTLQDANNPKDEITQVNNFKVNEIPNSIYVSDIQLYSFCKSSAEVKENMYKNGFVYEPLPYQLVDKNLNILMSYFEIYNIKQFSEKNYIIKFELFQQDSNLSYIKTAEWFKSKLTTENGIVLNQKDISALSSGHYKFVVSLMNKQGNILNHKQTEFDRYNPFWDRLLTLNYSEHSEEDYFNKLSVDSIHYYLKAMNVILPSTERETLSNLDRNGKEVAQRMYLYRFWKDNFGKDCVAKFEKFKRNVLYADVNFVSGFRYGFESDRGVTFLKYGSPVEVIPEDNDNGAYPYEIWMYDKLPTGQSNVRFLFYNPDLTGANFILLHTNCYGERFNKKWELELYRKVNEEYEGDDSVDATRIKKSINRHAREYFEY